MVLLQRLHRQSFGLDRTHCPDACFNTTDGGEDWNTALNRRAANFNFVFPRGFAAWRIDDQIDLVILDHIDDVRPAFVQLESRCAIKPAAASAAAVPLVA